MYGTEDGEYEPPREEVKSPQRGSVEVLNEDIETALGHTEMEADDLLRQCEEERNQKSKGL